MRFAGIYAAAWKLDFITRAGLLGDEYVSPLPDDRVDPLSCLVPDALADRFPETSHGSDTTVLRRRRKDA